MVQAIAVNEERAEIEGDALAALEAAMRGPILTADSPGYDEERQVWNRMIDKRPAVIVRATGTADVVAAVNFAREHGLLLAVHGGGHGVAGNATCDGGLMLDLSLMKGIYIDCEKGTAHAQGGVTWGDLDRETQLHGLATPGGVVSTTGIAGLTLGGGYGWLRSKCGLSCDALVSAEVVTADGRVLYASEVENEDLFWAIRGGGGNFGVVTSFEYQLHPVGPMVNLVAVMYPNERSAEIIPIWRDFVAGSPREFSSNCMFWTVPDNPHFPPEARNRGVIILVGVHSGPLEEGAAFVQPLRELGDPLVDLSGQLPFAVVQSMFDWVSPEGEVFHYWKSLHLNEINQEVISIIADRVQNRPAEWTMFDIWAMDGAVQDVAPEASAMGDRSAPYTAVFNTSWHDPAKSDECIQWTRDFYEQLRPFSPGSTYLNFPGFMEEEGLVKKSYGSNYPRLAALKAKYDPTNLFRLNQNIKPELHP